MSFDSKHPYRPPQSFDRPDFADQPDLKLPEASKHSGFGIASFSLALVAGISTFAVLVVAGVMESQTPGGMDPEGSMVMLIGCGIMAAMGLHVAGFCLGIAGLLHDNRKKVFAILGLTFNSFVLLGICGILALGVSVG